MAFGQQSGPPATAKQIRELLDLLIAAGHSDFRDARGPMGFSQRQAGGKFSRDEAQAFIDQLEQAANDADNATSSSAAPARAPRPKPSTKQSASERLLQDMPAELLAAELQRRGWIVVEP